MNPAKVFGGLLRSTMVGLATGFCFTRFVAEPILLQGPSMEPTLQHNDVIIANKYASIFKKDNYKKGDIVVVRSPINPNSFICKRIAALPGETVRVGYFSKLVQVPRGHVWLMGDNKTNSTDSREFGPLPIGLIIGVVVFRVWPIDQARKFEPEEARSI